MRYILIIITLQFLCCQRNFKYPEGGFDYPDNVSNADTNYYYYAIKDILPKRDAFRYAYAYLFFQPFDEPNLSIKPQKKETFRLTYFATMDSCVVITLTENQIIVKKGSPNILYGEDTSRLTNMEKFHLNLLEKRFPIDTIGKTPFVKQYLDSLTKLYPQLLDARYYHKLYDKRISSTGEVFTYSITKLNLTKQQYSSLVQEINSSGFWSMEYNVECENQPMDAYGFTLEANTKKKYKIVTAGACPDDTTKFTKACQKIIDFAKLDKEIKLIWSGKTITVE